MTKVCTSRTSLFGLQRHPNAAIPIYIDDNEYNPSCIIIIGSLSPDSGIEDECNNESMRISHPMSQAYRIWLAIPIESQYLGEDQYENHANEYAGLLHIRPHALL